MFAREKKEEKAEVGKHLRIKVERYSIERRGRKREREREGERRTKRCGDCDFVEETVLFQNVADP